MNNNIFEVGNGIYKVNDSVGEKGEVFVIGDLHGDY